MLKFIKHHMETITGIEIYPILSFLIFFAVFSIALIYVIFADKKTMDERSQIPLNTNDTSLTDHEK